MRLILVRHGNTFSPGDKIVWVGGKDDVPLVAEGVRQAQRLGAAMRAARIVPAAIHCGPLQRTRRCAEIVLSGLGLGAAPVIDERLREIDYGAWSGLANDEIAAAFGAEELDRWQRESVWPATAGWRPDEAEIVANIEDLSRDLAGRYGSDDTVLCISSNGVLRYFLELCDDRLEGRFRNGAMKVSTGHVCELRHEAGRFRVVSWNRSPADALGVSVSEA